MAQAQQPDTDSEAEAYKLIDTNRDTENEFETWQEAQEQKDDMVALGASPEDFEIEPIENGTSMNGETPENGAAVESDDEPQGEVVDQTEFENDVPGDNTVEVVDSDENALTADERSISDDPIEWLDRSQSEFVDTINGTDAINKKGFRVLQHFYDIDVTSEVVVPPEETDFEYCRVKATAEMPDGRTAEAHGSAHVEREDDHYLLLEMADTRAKSRVLSDITGVGAVAVAELKNDENHA